MPHTHGTTVHSRGTAGSTLRSRWVLIALSGLSALSSPLCLSAQDTGTPSVRVGAADASLRLDGILDDSAWLAAELIDGLTMTEPVEGGDLVGRTRVRLLADPTALIIGVEAFDPDPSGVVSYSLVRDPELRSEDHVKIVLDPFLDGRSGYVFAVNPRGARYDALVANRGEGEDELWDAVWEAKTARTEQGWSAEIRIPMQSLTFRRGLREWGFNVERRTDRLQEVSRWASPIRDAKVTQTSRAGRITELPVFSTGIGLTVRPSFVGGFEKPDADSDTDGTWDPSLDFAQRIGPNVTAIGTVNTDFAETEVDTRQTNLTRFSQFFPEKRTFFLEGADIFDFGIGLTAGFRPNIVPFFTRRIGLLEGEEVPLRVGGKLSGRSGNTNFGALVTNTGSVDTLWDATTLGAVRIQQNVLQESTAGVIATFGDPAGAPGSYLVGTDFTFQTSRFAGDKNLLVGVWGLLTDREGLEGDRTAFGAKIDYPNDTWDVALPYQRIGDGFDPSLGFVPRRGIQNINPRATWSVRPGWSWLRLIRNELFPSLTLDLDGNWESYRIFTAPINWTFESGERFEFNFNPEGERLVEPFEIADGVVIPPGSYHFIRYRMEADIASKRKVSGRVTWWFGPFYDGSLDQLELRMNINPTPLATIELNMTRNTGSLPGGDFTQELYGGRLRLNLSPDLEFSGFVQYDDDTRELGANTRLRWTFSPLGDLFVVYNHNVENLTDRWELSSNQLLIKLSYAFRY
jgi:hypothetical protein